jgi:NADPH-ferrihemoprotein reductase
LTGCAGFEACVKDMENFTPEDVMAGGLMVFLLATFGEGDPTDNAITFWRWLKDDNKELSSTALQRLKFSVFGLGSTEYEHFNKMGKNADRRMAELGGTRVLPLGLGNANENIEEDFEKWHEDLWPALSAAVGASTVVSLLNVLGSLRVPHPPEQDGSL